MERDTFPDPWAEEAFARCLDDLFLVSVSAGGLVGYVIARAVSSQGEVLSIGVTEQRRRQGVASGLLGECVARFRSQGVVDLYLEVRESNRAARLFYQKNGFQRVGFEPNFYRNPLENALVLCRKIFPG